jgi:hypothetical protein
MPRPYSGEFLRQLSASTDLDSTGIKLGKLCVANNLSASHVAAVLGVTRTTIYGWFRGHGIREKKLKDVEAFIQLIEEGVREKKLPVNTVEDSKRFMDEIMGVHV